METNKFNFVSEEPKVSEDDYDNLKDIVNKKDLKKYQIIYKNDSKKKFENTLFSNIKETQKLIDKFERRNLTQRSNRCDNDKEINVTARFVRKRT
jgi:hypothetical protein